MQWDRESRTAYYTEVKKSRGEAAAKDLVTEVKRQWLRQQESRTKPLQGGLL